MLFGAIMAAVYGMLSLLSALEDNWNASIAWLCCLLLIYVVVFGW